MTIKELERFNRGNELKKKIDLLRSEIKDIEYNFNKDLYPRSETNWKLSATINNNLRTIYLNSDEYWKCIKVVLNIKRDRLNKLIDEFAKL